MSRANDAAYPVNTTNESNPGAFEPHFGLTLREHFAGLAMQGILANEASANFAPRVHGAHVDIAGAAVKMADALLAELSKPVTP